MEKYVVFKVEQWARIRKEIIALMPAKVAHDIVLYPPLIEDAIVIRRQDVFSPPAFDAYANAIATAIEVAVSIGVPKERLNGLQDTADFFHEQASLAWDTDRKIPD